MSTQHLTKVINLIALAIIELHLSEYILAAVANSQKEAF